MASTVRPICRNSRMSEATTKVFPTSVPVAVIKIAVTIRRLVRGMKAPNVRQYQRK
jgi:hypothetical protein